MESLCVHLNGQSIILDEKLPSNRAVTGVIRGGELINRMSAKAF